MAEVDRPHESGEFETSLRPRARPERERLIADSWARGYAEGMAKVRAKGWAEDLYRELTMDAGLNTLRYLLVRQATLRFDAETGERLSDLLDEIRDFGHLVEAGAWVILSATGNELITRVDEVVRSTS